MRAYKERPPLCRLNKACMQFRVQDDQLYFSKAKIAFRQNKRHFIRSLIKSSQHFFKQELDFPKDIQTNPKKLKRIYKGSKELTNKIKLSEAQLHQLQKQYSACEKVKPVRFVEESVRDISSSFTVMRNSVSVLSLKRPQFKTEKAELRRGMGFYNSQKYSNFYEEMQRSDLGDSATRQQIKLINFREIAGIINSSGQRIQSSTVERWVRKFG